ncbi:hypothetical protein GA0115280_10047 [Streptomyces sp. Cmuel-A718b]|nr:hypothetical protein GA0115280_10047 [Streptomyces sp. Cmuel-A718b]
MGALVKRLAVPHLATAKSPLTGDRVPLPPRITGRPARFGMSTNDEETNGVEFRHPASHQTQAGTPVWQRPRGRRTQEAYVRPPLRPIPDHPYIEMAQPLHGAEKTDAPAHRGTRPPPGGRGAPGRSPAGERERNPPPGRTSRAAPRGQGGFKTYRAAGRSRTGRHPSGGIEVNARPNTPECRVRTGGFHEMEKTPSHFLPESSFGAVRQTGGQETTTGRTRRRRNRTLGWRRSGCRGGRGCSPFTAVPRFSA